MQQPSLQRIPGPRRGEHERRPAQGHPVRTVRRRRHGLDGCRTDRRRPLRDVAPRGLSVNGSGRLTDRVSDLSFVPVHELAITESMVAAVADSVGPARVARVRLQLGRLAGQELRIKHVEGEVQ